MTQLQKIVAEAKKIRKAHPKKYAKWTDYIKAASKKVKPAKKVGAVKRKATKAQHKDTKSHNVNVKVVSGVGYVHIVKPNLSTKKIPYYGIYCEEISGKKYFAGNNGKPAIMTKTEAIRLKKSIDSNNKIGKFFKKVIIKKII